MGYYIEQLDCKFFMPKENFSEAISVSKLLLTKETKNKNARGKRMWYSPKNEIKIDKHYAWVNEQEVLNATTFEGVAEAFRWDTEKDSEGNVTDFIFNGAGSDIRGLGKEARRILEKDLIYSELFSDLNYIFLFSNYVFFKKDS